MAARRSSSSGVGIPLAVGVFLFPLAWLALVMMGVSHENPFFELEPGRIAWPVAVGVTVGLIAGACAGVAALAGRSGLPAFVAMSVVASINSWWVMFVIVALGSTSGHGIAWAQTLPSVLSWALAFASFAVAARVVRAAPGR